MSAASPFKRLFGAAGGKEMTSPAQGPKRLLALLKSPLFWVLSLICGFVLWYSHECHDERKSAVADLKGNFVLTRTADEQTIEAAIAAIRETYSWISYLEQGPIDLQTVKAHLGSVITSQEIAYSTCAKSNEALGKYMNALTNVSHLFDFEEEDRRQMTLMELSFDCSMWNDYAGYARSVDPARLVADPEYRQRFISSFERQRTKAEKLQKNLKAWFASDYSRMEKSIADLEERRFSIVVTLWDCARHFPNL